jgi:hypothetical protein
MRGAISTLPLYVFMAWCLVKHRDNFTFTFMGKYVKQKGGNTFAVSGFYVKSEETPNKMG